MGSNGHLSGSIKKKLLTVMLCIRRTEEVIASVYPQNHMRTPTHLSIGQEAVAAGVCLALGKDDTVFSSHRNHAHYLAKGGSLEALFGELCGRVTGCNKGRVGSAHVSDSAIGLFASPILASMIPVAVGTAFSFAMDSTGQVAVAFFGDAAIEEGVFAESLNFAILHKLPVLFVCENNLYSTHAHIRTRQPSSPIIERVKIPELKALQVDGNDVLKVYLTVRELVEECRHGKGPVFLECLTYRIREHVGPYFDYDKGYRTKKEVDGWIKKCPISRLQNHLTANNVMAQEDIDALARKMETQAMEAYQKALQSPWPDPDTILDFVY